MQQNLETPEEKQQTAAIPEEKQETEEEHEALVNRCRDLATRIYNLDSRVYTHVGSSLGRTLISPREKSIDILTHELLISPKNEFILKTMALIARMGRTIKDKPTKARLMSEYNSIMKELDALEPAMVSTDIGDKARISLNPFAIPGHRTFSSDDRLVICIGRSFGSAGTDIGFRLADELHINYYDATIFQDVLDRKLAEQEANEQGGTVESHLEDDQSLKGLKRWVRDFNRFHGLPKQDALFFQQSEYIEHLAKNEDLVIMGRCADVVLRNARIPHVSIYITAPEDIRIRRVKEIQKLSFKDAAHMVRANDKAHERFYHRYTGLQWGKAINYDLCVNSANYGIDESVELIMRVIRARIREVQRK
ncbi:MAG: cytidylate kinase-like family protein [Stomatobaculum sp.]|nr:cytidylate kinase-like family protein [Stomatobaculum sp.]